MLMDEGSKYLQQEGSTKAIFRTTILTDMVEEFHRMETVMKVNLITTTCMVMGFILTWKIRNDMKAFGKEVKSKEFSEFMIELEESSNV